MFCVSNTREESPSRLMEDVECYRHKVFVNRLDWPLYSFGEVESEEFDGTNTVYASSRDKHDQVGGVTKFLLETFALYLRGKVFPPLWGQSELPRSGKVWNMSQFPAVDCNTCMSLSNQASKIPAGSLFWQVVRAKKRSMHACQCFYHQDERGYAVRTGESLMSEFFSILPLNICLSTIFRKCNFSAWTRN